MPKVAGGAWQLRALLKVQSKHIVLQPERVVLPGSGKEGRVRVCLGSRLVVFNLTQDVVYVDLFHFTAGHTEREPLSF